MTRPLRLAARRFAPLLATAACSALVLVSAASAGTTTKTTTRTNSSTSTRADGRWVRTESSYRDDDQPIRFAYVRVHSDDHSKSGSGETSDFAAAERLEQDHAPTFLYLRRDADRFVIDDPALLARSEDILEPMDLLGRQQALLGSKQATLGASQARLGHQQAELGRDQAVLGIEQSRLSSQLSRRAAGERSAADLERRIAAIAEQQSALGERQGELGEQQSELGQQQAELGEQQSRLGERQTLLHPQVVRGLMALLDDALASGRAERVAR